jgi:hypothetical protein
MPSKLTKDRTTLFLHKYGEDLARALVGTNIFFAGAVGQKCNESAFGTSKLAVNYNNFGGIKGRPREASGKTSNGWAIFATPYDCFKSYARFLSELPIYTKALAETTPERQIIAIVEAGYCETGWQIIDGKRVYFSAQDYLKICQGAIDSTRIITPAGSGRIATLSQIAAQIKGVDISLIKV